ncbi:hypothetical protein [Sphingomonas sp. PAMC 26605]|uniref:hypothetical protein n=1 Tax=Sphingomonas sp. PAMC 26605 TaxID=1112214 RepID=UPI0006860DE7|nr:hypothetical protein [Sphingomonas sp. PAMC 26605]
MAAVSNFEHLTRAPHMLSSLVEEVYDQYVVNLQTGASTVDVNGLRTCSMAITIIAAGVIGTFEGMLQQHFMWGDAYTELDKVLRHKGRDDLADRFLDYRLGVNVLKHGVGRSYDTLLTRRAALPFVMKGKGEAFFNEGDVSEVGGLVDTRGPFIQHCVEIINEIRCVIGLE